MPRDDYGVIRQRQYGIMQRAQDLLHVATRQIGAADRAGEERVSGDQLFLRLEEEANAAFGVAGCVQDLRSVRSGGDGLDRKSVV